jgi:DNA-binding MarR family transcriptional regulator
MASPKPPTLDQHLCFRLYSTSLKMTQLYKPMLAKLNLTYPQYLVMVVLWEEEGLGIKDLAERLQLDSGSVTPVVKRLEAEGYLIRDRDQRDERNRVLTLTAAGQELRVEGVKIAKAIAKACSEAGDHLHPLMDGLAALNAQLSA